MRTVTILAATLIGLTPLPLAYSFQTLSTHPTPLNAPSLPTLTPPLFQRTTTFHGTLPIAPAPMPVPVPASITETTETPTPTPAVEETEDDMAIQPTPGRDED